MKTALLVALFSFSSLNAFALSNEELANTCLERGAQKISMQAKAWNCQLTGEVTVQSVDNRLDNPSKYITYTASANCPNGLESIAKLVQYYKGQCI